MESCFWRRRIFIFSAKINMLAVLFAAGGLLLPPSPGFATSPHVSSLCSQPAFAADCRPGFRRGRACDTHVCLREGHSDRNAQSLPQRARCRFHVGKPHVVGVPLERAAERAKLGKLSLVDAAGASQRSVQHRHAVALREHEPVTPGPGWLAYPVVSSAK